MSTDRPLPSPASIAAAAHALIEAARTSHRPLTEYEAARTVLVAALDHERAGSAQLHFSPTGAEVRFGFVARYVVGSFARAVAKPGNNGGTSPGGGWWIGDHWMGLEDAERYTTLEAAEAEARNLVERGFRGETYPDVRVCRVWQAIDPAAVSEVAEVSRFTPPPAAKRLANLERQLAALQRERDALAAEVAAAPVERAHTYDPDGRPVPVAATMADVPDFEPVIAIAQPIGNCDGSGLYAYNPTTEDGRGAPLAAPCPGCRACR